MWRTISIPAGSNKQQATRKNIYFWTVMPSRPAGTSLTPEQNQIRCETSGFHTLVSLFSDEISHVYGNPNCKSFPGLSADIIFCSCVAFLLPFPANSVVIWKARMFFILLKLVLYHVYLYLRSYQSVTSLFSSATVILIKEQFSENLFLVFNKGNDFIGQV